MFVGSELQDFLQIGKVYSYSAEGSGGPEFYHGLSHFLELNL